jgi:menaquinone-dependent protoporphyrinogen oxidase
MCEVPIFYATTEGQTRRIAEHIADRIRRHGLDSRAVAIISEEASHIDWEHVRGAAVGASLHMAKHQAEAEAFARLHHEELNERASLFFSVSLSAASKNQTEVRAAEAIAGRFAVSTQWTPTWVVAVPGRLAYTQYNWFVRLFMRRIAVKEGASADTSRDHEYTNWDLVDQIADDLAYAIRRREIFPADGESFVRAAS